MMRKDETTTNHACAVVKRFNKCLVAVFTNDRNKDYNNNYSNYNNPHHHNNNMMNHTICICIAGPPPVGKSTLVEAPGLQILSLTLEI